jgi:hypothetical protein
MCKDAVRRIAAVSPPKLDKRAAGMIDLGEGTREYRMTTTVTPGI